MFLVNSVIMWLDAGYLLHVHWPGRVWMIFSSTVTYSVMITTFFLGGGGNFSPLNTLERTLDGGSLLDRRPN